MMASPSSKDISRPAPTVNGLFFRRFWHLLKLTVFADGITALRRRRTRLNVVLVILVLLLSVGEQVFVYVIGQTVCEVITETKKEEQEAHLLNPLQWRSWLVKYMHKLYFGKNFPYYRVSLETNMDNPDIRMTSDIDRWSHCIGAMLGPVVTAPTVIIYYTVFTYMRLSWFAPAVVFAYFLVGVVVNRLLMAPIVPLVFNQERLEGNFRFTHVRVRTHAECVAFLQGGAHERHVAEDDLDALIDNKKRVILKELWLSLSTKGFAYAGSLLNYAVVAVAVLWTIAKAFAEVPPDRQVEFISQAATGCLMLVNGCSSLIELSPVVSDLAGFTSRISELVEFMEHTEQMSELLHCTKPGSIPKGGNEVAQNVGLEEMPPKLLGEASPEMRSKGGPTTASTALLAVASDDPPHTGDETESAVIVRFASNEVALCDITCSSLEGKVVARNLCFSVRADVSHDEDSSVPQHDLCRGPHRTFSSLLIVGPSGAGKSTILRVLAGIWPATSGTLVRPSLLGAGGIFFLPQRPYVVSGTLRDQIVYPSGPLSILARIHAQADSDYAHNMGIHVSSADTRDYVAIGGSSISQVPFHAPVGSAADMDDGTIIALLESVGLKPIYERLRLAAATPQDSSPTARSHPDQRFNSPGLDCPKIIDWNDVLTPGEQQLLCIARLLYHRPRFAVLDEATSSLDTEAEELVYRRLKEANIALISVGHRHSLRQFHQISLALDGEGGSSFVSHDV